MKKITLRLIVVPVLLACEPCIAPSQGQVSIPGIAKDASKAVVVVTVRDAKGAALGTGSGFLVTADGVLVTNYHVIDGGYSASVKVADGDIYDAVFVIDTDKRKDLAILKIKAINLPTSKLGDSDKIEVGQHVIAIGNPYGFLSGSVSDGIVSAVRQFEGYKAIQTTAPISPGSSGGPLLNDMGQVVGITAATFDGQNLNIAIPINYLKPLLQSLDVGQMKTLAAFNVNTLKVAPAQESDKAVVPSSQKSFPLDGAWSATIADSKGSGTLQFNLVQNSEGAVVGTYTSSLGGGGRISGSLVDADFSFELTQSLQGCPGIFKGKGQLMGEKLSGTYTGTDCMGDRGTGTFTMTRSAGSNMPAIAQIPPEARANIIGYLEKMLGRWSEEEARVLMGEPSRHEYGYDQQKTIINDIFEYPDPTGNYRVFQLGFDIKTKHLIGILVFPLNMTWEQCKRTWGDKVTTVRNSDGTRVYAYKDRRIKVMAAKDGRVITFAIY